MWTRRPARSWRSPGSRFRRTSATNAHSAGSDHATTPDGSTGVQKATPNGTKRTAPRHCGSDHPLGSGIAPTTTASQSLNMEECLPRSEPFRHLTMIGISDLFVGCHALLCAPSDHTTSASGCPEATMRPSGRHSGTRGWVITRAGATMPVVRYCGCDQRRPPQRHCSTVGKATTAAEGTMPHAALRLLVARPPARCAPPCGTPSDHAVVPAIG
jgi:hypothetical protein